MNTSNVNEITSTSIWPAELKTGGTITGLLGVPARIWLGQPKGAVYIGKSDAGIHYCCVPTTPKMNLVTTLTNETNEVGTLTYSVEKGSSYSFSQKVGVSVTAEAEFNVVVASGKVGTTISAELRFEQAFSKAISLSATMAAEKNMITALYTGSFQVQYYGLVSCGPITNPSAIWLEDKMDHIQTGAYAAKSFPLNETPVGMLP